MSASGPSFDEGGMVDECGSGELLSPDCSPCWAELNGPVSDCVRPSSTSSWEAAAGRNFPKGLYERSPSSSGYPVDTVSGDPKQWMRHAQARCFARDLNRSG